MKILIVVGARPNFMKAAPILKAIRAFNSNRAEWADGILPVLVHTGQNTAKNLSDIFFSDLGVRAPDRHLGVDTSSLGRQLATLFESFEKVLDEVNSLDWR